MLRSVAYKSGGHLVCDVERGFEAHCNSMAQAPPFYVDVAAVFSSCAFLSCASFA
jgi:hypothetical protein